MNTVISCFDYTTNMLKPWAENGYDCYAVDIKHPAGYTTDGYITRVGADMLEWLPPRKQITAAFFFPPCTDVAVSGARWFRDKGLGCLINALRLFERSVMLAEWMECPYMIENPVSTVSSYWRKPDYIFQPWEYGDMYSKKPVYGQAVGLLCPRLCTGRSRKVLTNESGKCHLRKTDPKNEVRHRKDLLMQFTNQTNRCRTKERE